MRRNLPGLFQVEPGRNFAKGLPVGEGSLKRPRGFKGEGALESRGGRELDSEQLQGAVQADPWLPRLPP